MLREQNVPIYQVFFYRSTYGKQKYLIEIDYLARYVLFEYFEIFIMHT